MVLVELMESLFEVVSSTTCLLQTYLVLLASSELLQHAPFLLHVTK